MNFKEFEKLVAKMHPTSLTTTFEEHKQRHQSTGKDLLLDIVALDQMAMEDSMDDLAWIGWY